MIGCVLKLIFLPLYLPFYLIWEVLGRILGGKHRHYDLWKW